MAKEGTWDDVLSGLKKQDDRRTGWGSQAHEGQLGMLTQLEEQEAAASGVDLTDPKAVADFLRQRRFGS